MQQITRDILENRLAKIRNAYTDTQIDLDDFINKFADQIDVLRKRDTHFGFKWTDPMEPKTIDNLEWSKDHRDPALMSALSLQKVGIERSDSGQIISVHQWISELKAARSSK